MDFRRIVLRVVGGVLGLLAGLWLTGIPACCCTSADVTMSGPSVLEVCEVAEYVAAGQPQGGDYQWSAGVGEIVSGQGTSQIQYKAPDDPEVGSVVISVTYSVPCPDDPNETIHAGTSMVVAITPKDCTNGGPGPSDLHVSTDGIWTLHINDPSDRETLTAGGSIDPDSTECGCARCGGNGMDLGATEWQSLDPTDLRVTNDIGPNTDVYSKSTKIGQFRVRATFHDKAEPNYCNDDEGSSWSVTKTFQTFRVGARVSVSGVEPATLWEDDAVESKTVPKTLDEVDIQRLTSNPETVSFSDYQKAECVGTFALLADPSCGMKGFVHAYIGGANSTGRAGVHVWDSDFEPDKGNITVTVEIIPGIVSISTTYDNKGDDVMSGAGVGYGATIKGGGSSERKVEIVSTTYEPTANTLNIPAWSSDTTLSGSPGTTSQGEVEVNVSIAIDDGSPWTRAYARAHCTESCGDVPPTVEWKLTARPVYQRQ